MVKGGKDAKDRIRRKQNCCYCLLAVSCQGAHDAELPEGLLAVRRLFFFDFFFFSYKYLC